MTEPLSQHLTSDELELWAQGLLPAARDIHLAQCGECRVLGDRERKLFRELARLPRLAPGVGVVERAVKGGERRSTAAALTALHRPPPPSTVLTSAPTPTPNSRAALPSLTAISTMPPLPTKATSCPRATSPNVRPSGPISVPASVMRAPGLTSSPGTFDTRVPKQSW